MVETKMQNYHMLLQSHLPALRDLCMSKVSPANLPAFITKIMAMCSVLVFCSTKPNSVMLSGDRRLRLSQSLNNLVCCECESGYLEDTMRTHWAFTAYYFATSNAIVEWNELMRMQEITADRSMRKNQRKREKEGSPQGGRIVQRDRVSVHEEDLVLAEQSGARWSWQQAQRKTGWLATSEHLLAL